MAVYLRRREKELDEYERLLFGEDTAPPLRKSLLRPKTRLQKRLLPLRILPNNAGRNRTK